MYMYVTFNISVTAIVNRLDDLMIISNIFQIKQLFH